MSGIKLEIVDCVPLTETASVVLVRQSGTNFSLFRADRNCKVGLFSAAVCYIIHAQTIHLVPDAHGAAKILVEAEHIILNESTELQCSIVNGYIWVKVPRDSE